MVLTEGSVRTPDIQDWEGRQQENMNDERMLLEWYIYHRLERKKLNSEGNLGLPDSTA